MKERFSIFSFILLVSASVIISCQQEERTSETGSENSLPRSTPEAEGISSQAIITLLDEIEKSGIEFHSIMLVRNDKVVAEGWWHPYKPEFIHTLYSLSKSFTSTAVGFAVEEGIISLDDKVVSFFPEDLPDTVDQKLSSMEIRHLLTMSTGHEEGTLPGMIGAPDGNWPRAFLSQKLTWEPGEQFMYNTGATYMLSAILQSQTGITLLEYLKPRFFEPLDMEGMDWEQDPKGVNVGGYGLRVKTEDIAKLGLLYLHKGIYNGKRLLSEEWIEEATRKQIDSYPGDGDWSQGYGYQFWRCKPLNMYRGDGAFGQFCIVMPDQNMVISITSESKDMQASMQLLWDHLLPGINEGSLPKDQEGVEILKEKLDNLTVITPDLARNADFESAIQGRVLTLDSNAIGFKRIRFGLSDNQIGVYGSDTLTLDFGWNEWMLNQVRGSMPLGANVDSYIAVKAGFDEMDNLVMERQFVEMAHRDRLTFRFENRDVSMKWKESVSLWTEGNVGREIIISGMIEDPEF